MSNAIKHLTEAGLFSNLKILLENDKEMKTLLRKKDQIESEYNAAKQKYKVDIEDINDKIVKRKDELKQQRLANQEA